VPHGPGSCRHARRLHDLVGNILRHCGCHFQKIEVMRSSGCPRRLIDRVEIQIVEPLAADVVLLDLNGVVLMPSTDASIQPMLMPAASGGTRSAAIRHDGRNWPPNESQLRMDRIVAPKSSIMSVALSHKRLMLMFCHEERGQPVV